MCLPCRQAGKDNAAKSAQQQPLAKRRRVHIQQPADAPQKQPNPSYLAYSIQHTRAEYADRYHPLKGVLKACSRQDTTTLQPIQIADQADDSVLPRVSILTREYPHLSSQLVWHPIGKHVLNEAAMQTVPQNCHAWHLARHGCVTASSCHLFLGFYEPVSSELGIKAPLRKHSKLETAVQQLQQAPSSAGTASQNVYQQWGHEHEANALETFLDHYKAAHVYEQSFQLLRALPAQLTACIDLAQLPLIGASPDGLIDKDPDSVNAQGCVLELKTKVPFCQDDKDGKWHFISSSAPNAAVTAEHFCQVQIQMLVTGKSKAYLVSWAHKAAKIFKIDVHFQWLQAALLLLCDTQQQYLGQGQTPPEVFYKASAAKKLRDLTKTALAEVNAQGAVVAEAVQNKQASQKLI